MTSFFLLIVIRGISEIKNLHPEYCFEGFKSDGLIRQASRGQPQHQHQRLDNLVPRDLGGP
jgi:hypothetical protein